MTNGRGAEAGKCTTCVNYDTAAGTPATGGSLHIFGFCTRTFERIGCDSISFRIVGAYDHCKHYDCRDGLSHD